MRKKRFFPGYTFVVFTLILLTGCKKTDAPPVTPETPATPSDPESSKEVQTALDIAWATYVITDIEQMCAFMAENELFNTFYTHLPGTPPLNQVTVERNVQAKDLRALFNDSPCLDGRMRQGTIFMRYTFDPVRRPGANPNSEYYDEYGFSGQLSLLNYRVDGWRVENYDPRFPAYVYNEMKGIPFYPKTTKHKWQIAGKFKLTHVTDTFAQRSIVWDGKIFKTLENTSDPLVYSITRLIPINWSLAVCSYTGNVKGLTNSDNPFNLEAGTLNDPLVRDFTCNPDKIAEEHHPFIKGSASFTTGSVYPCQIYFGDVSNPAHGQCDSVGLVKIKGVSFKVNYRK
jgi:hypothetical protein